MMSPKRGPGWVPKLSFHPPRKCGRVRIPGQGIVYLGQAGCWKSKRQKAPAEVVEEYNREIAAWLATRTETATAQHAAPLASVSTVAELAAAYLDYAKRTFRKRDQPTKHVSLIKLALKPFLKLFASKVAADFTAGDLRSYRDHLESEGKWNRAGVNAALGRIRKMFQWGSAERDMFSTDVWLRLKAVSGLLAHRTTAREPTSDRPVLASLVDATLPHLPEIVAAMVRLQRVTGMRPLEVCWMRVNEITEEDDGLWKYLASDAGNKMAHLGIAKVVFFGPTAQTILLPWINEARKISPTAWVWPKRYGAGNILPTRYGEIIRESCDKHGLERWHPRALRHSKATETRRKYGLEGAQAVLGHEISETTQGYSSQALETLARKIALESG